MGRDGERAADFVRRFTEFWQAPAVERLDTVLAPGARLAAPLTPTTLGLDAGKRAFAELFELIPDMTAEVHRWGTTQDGVLIEFTVRGTAGGAPVSWESVDRFVLNEEGLATERFTYFDSLPLVLSLLRRPRAWPGFLRSRIGQTSPHTERSAAAGAKRAARAAG
jgi:SnoaL-like domain